MNGAESCGRNGRNRSAREKSTRSVPERRNKMSTATGTAREARPNTRERPLTPTVRPNLEIHVSGWTVDEFTSATGFDLGPGGTSRYLRDRIAGEARIVDAPPARYADASRGGAELYAVIGETWVFRLEWRDVAWQTDGFADLEEEKAFCSNEGRQRPAASLRGDRKGRSGSRR